MNIINAIINLVNNPVTTIHAHYVGRNRANNMGDALEEYIKDLFCNTFNEDNETKRIEKVSAVMLLKSRKLRKIILPLLSTHHIQSISYMLTVL